MFGSPRAGNQPTEQDRQRNENQQAENIANHGKPPLLG
jgi:hypothetical protein